MRSPVGMTVPLLNNARASIEHLVLHEYYLFPLGLLINELGGVLEPPSAGGEKGPRVSTETCWKGRKTP